MGYKELVVLAGVLLEHQVFARLRATVHSNTLRIGWGNSVLAPNPEEAIEHKELRTLSWRAIWGLPADLRRVITHLYICDRSPEETAVMLNMDTKKLQSLHNRALENLRVRVKIWQ